ncbi:MAG: LCP family protein, partial [Chloroflexi bacterium]|nr:LCP family protein [Chloroflexota bacterium]
DGAPAPADTADTTPPDEGATVPAAEPAPEAVLDESPLVVSPERTTVLVLGIDQRGDEEGPFPTDTIILLSIDEVAQTGAILSIPRDLWVEIPNQPLPHKINQAYIIGENNNYAGGGGPLLAMHTVEQLLGLRRGDIDYYVVVNFDVFLAVVEPLEPIEVCPESEIRDEEYPDGSYGYMTVYFPAGCQDLNAEKLLQYARTRHGNSDVDRSARQQEVIMAVRSKVFSLGGVVALLPEAWDLWNALQDDVETNMSIEEIIRLARAAEAIPEGNIRRSQITLDDVYTAEINNEQVLIPIPTDILVLMENLFRPPD